MTRKHYNMLAQIIQREVVIKQLAGQTTIDEEQMIMYLCHALKLENERFDQTRFKGACGL